MKIYLASSWKNEFLLKNIKYFLKNGGNAVDLFCDLSGNARKFIFSFDLLGDIKRENNITIRQHSVIENAFLENKKWIEWADLCIMVLPCGKSSHLEAGYAKGIGKKLIIFAPTGFPLGDLDVMYNFADYMCCTFEDLDLKLMEWR